MAQPWKTLQSLQTPDGILELRQRGERDFLILVGTQVLMNSSLHRSEVALGVMACSHLMQHGAAKVLVGGLGMAITLRAVLNQLSPTATVLVAELNPVVFQWCQGPLAALTANAATDPRVSVEFTDVAAVIRKSAEAGERFDSIVLDLYTGPDANVDKMNDPLYGSRAIEFTRAALKPGGVLGVWGENYDAGFEKRLRMAGFVVVTERPGRGGLRHVVYLARLPRK